jgi:hypothetical protein
LEQFSICPPFICSCIPEKACFSFKVNYLDIKMAVLPVILDVGLQLKPEIVHLLLHVVLEGGELLQVTVPHLILPPLELRPGAS